MRCCCFTPFTSAASAQADHETAALHGKAGCLALQPSRLAARCQNQRDDQHGLLHLHVISLVAPVGRSPAAPARPKEGPLTMSSRRRPSPPVPEKRLPKSERNACPKSEVGATAGWQCAATTGEPCRPSPGRSPRRRCATEPKRHHVGGLDRVDHLFGAANCYNCYNSLVALHNGTRRRPPELKVRLHQLIQNTQAGVLSLSSG